jgi:hypothetical protein
MASNAKVPTSSYLISLLKAQAQMGRRKQDLDRTFRSTAKTFLISGGVSLGAVLLALAVPQRVAEKLLGGLFFVVLWTGSILVLIPFFMAIASGFNLIRLAPRFLGGIRRVACPNCSTTHDLFLTTTRYLCPECKTNLCLSSGASSALTLAPVSCRHCGRRMALSSDCEPSPCGNCGADLMREGGGISIRPSEKPCPNCGASLASGARFCASCDGIFGQPAVAVSRRFASYYFGNASSGWIVTGAITGKESQTFDALLVLDERGALADAKARIANLPKPACDEESLLSYFSSQLPDFTCKQLQFSLADPRLRDHVVHALRTLDHAHAQMLDAVLAVLSANGKKGLSMELIKGIELSYIESRRLLYNQVRGIDPEAADSSLPDTAPLSFGKYAKGAKRGLISRPEEIKSLSDKLKSSASLAASF